MGLFPGRIYSLGLTFLACEPRFNDTILDEFLVLQRLAQIWPVGTQET